MKKIPLSLIFAAFLGVALMLTPLMLLHKGVETVDGVKPETPKSATLVERDETYEKTEALTIPTAPVVKVNWLKLASTVVFGAIPAAAISIIVKRKLRV